MDNFKSLFPWSVSFLLRITYQDENSFLLQWIANFWSRYDTKGTAVWGSSENGLWSPSDEDNAKTQGRQIWEGSLSLVFKTPCQHNSLTQEVYQIRKWEQPVIIQLTDPEPNIFWEFKALISKRKYSCECKYTV